MREFPVLLLALILGSVGHLATDIYLPSLPNIMEYFGTTTNAVQLTLTVYMLSFCLTPLVMGPISDQIGRKKPILIGLGLSLVASIICTFADNIVALIFARFFQGIGLGMVATVSRTILPDNFSGPELAKKFSYMSMFMPLALAIGPPLGGFIQDHASWRAVFGLLMFHILILCFMVKFFFNDKSSPVLQSEKGKTFDNMKRSYGELLKNTPFLRYAFCSVLLFMGITAYLTVNPFLFQTVFGITPTQNGCVALILLACSFLSGFLNSRLITVFSNKKLLYIANFLIISSGALLLSFELLNIITLQSFIVLVLPFFISVPIVFSTTGSLALSKVQGNFGAATALISTFQYFGGTVSSFLISFADQTSAMPLSFAYLLIGIVFFFTLFLEKPTPPLPEEVPE